MINLKMYKLRSFMGLLPMQFLYMISSDGTNALANMTMLDMVMVAHGEYIMDCELQRRNTLGSSLDGMGD